jgi:hypothetical protein
MQKYGLQIPGRLVLDLNSPIGFRLEQVSQEVKVEKSWDALVAEIADLKGKLMDKQRECERLRALPSSAEVKAAMPMAYLHSYDIAEALLHIFVKARAALAQPPAEEQK